MKKTLFLSIIFATFFSGCFFSSNSISTVEKKEISIPKDAPTWLHESKIENHISAIGIAKNIEKKELNFHKQKALINVSQNLTKRIYVKTVNLYTNYLNTLENPKIFDKDIKKFAEHISLKSLTHSKITNNWISTNNELYLQVSVDTNIVAEQIQNTSKLLFEVDKKLYQHFLSNRAKKDIIKFLEE